MSLTVSASKALDSLDVVKFCMALFIVAIHLRPLQGYPQLERLMQPVEACAVPFFFITSSFLFFRKNLSASATGLWSAFRKFALRIGRLYLFWFTVYLPYMLVRPDGYAHLVPSQWASRLFKDVFFGSTFRGSWFLSALLLSMLTIICLTRIQRTRTVWIIPLLIHAAVNGFIPGISFYEFPNLHFTLLNALWWVTAGYLLAASGAEAHTAHMSPKGKALLGAVCLLFWLAEGVSGIRFLSSFLLPVLITAWALCLKLRHRAVYQKLRTMSILFYLTHFAYATLLFRHIATATHDNPLWGLAGYTGALIFCLACSLVLTRLEKIRGLKWLRYAH